MIIYQCLRSKMGIWKNFFARITIIIFLQQILILLFYISLHHLTLSVLFICLFFISYCYIQRLQTFVKYFTRMFYKNQTFFLSQVHNTVPRLIDDSFNTDDSILAFIRFHEIQRKKYFMIFYDTFNNFYTSHNLIEKC